MAENLLDKLNDSQRSAVLYNDGPSLVIAGAGSGKTRVLTYKIAYLMQLGLEPYRILALTFTNKAAREMKERIATEVGADRAKYLWMGTFHSIFSRILRAEADKLGFSHNFTIYDSADSKSVLKSIIKDMKLDDKVYKSSNIACSISNAKNHLVSPEAYCNDSGIIEADKHNKVPLTGEIYRTYVERCHQANAMDFDDLLVYTYLLFTKHEDVRRQYADRFEYVLVDEYQDTNVAQHKIVWELTKEKQRVCVVGDDAQSIYSFRGANIENILGFTKSYKGSKVFKLEQNYRSTQTIVNAANSIISKNSNQIEKNVFSENSKGEPIEVYNAFSDKEEGAIVVNRIKQFSATEDGNYSRFAILYRTNSQSRIFEDELRRSNIPYRIYGGLSFYQRKEIKDVIAYLRMAVNPTDEEALKRIINYPARGIGETTIGKVSLCAHSNEVSMWDVLCRPVEYQLNVNKGTLAKLKGFQELIFGFQEMARHDNALEAGTKIIAESGIMKEMYVDRSADNEERRENIDELRNALQNFVEERMEGGNEEVSLSDFLSEVSLYSDLDQEDDKDETDKVTLMTIHAAKGLEFNTVFVVGMEENLFPSAMCCDSARALEEERRLFYVAVTRAEKHCILSFAKSRFRYGSMEFCSPSRFLKEMEPSCVKMMQGGTSPFAGASFKSREDEDRLPWHSGGSDYAPSYRPAMKPASKPASRPAWQEPVQHRKLRKMATVTSSFEPVSSASESYGGLKLGDRINHERFGDGVVVGLSGIGDNGKAIIRFDKLGEKTLLLKFAKFNKL